MLFLPELIVLLSALVMFLVSLGKPTAPTIHRLAVVLGAAVLLATIAGLGLDGSLFYESYRVDRFSQVFKLLIGSATLIVLLFSGTAPGVKNDVQAEYYLFLLIGVLGLMMLVSSVELLAIFVALELSSFAVYIMVPMRSRSGNVVFQMESGIKYLLFGVMTTGFMLFGMSYLFGLTGSTYLTDIIDALALMTSEPAAMVAIMMVLAGFFYKLALFPFHFWVPDIYEGAANETTAFIAAVPKIAATAMLIRIVSLAAGDSENLVSILLFCSIGSMFYGNLCALVQTDLKRMLGYSAISHAGFVLFGLLTFGADGYATSLYYVTGYAAMNLACFLVICTVATNGENLAIADLAGLHQRSPLLALTLAIGLFALAGIPPFVGFTGKFMLLVNAFKQGLIIPVILAALNTAIALFYYLSAVRMAYCTDPEKAGQTLQPGPLRAGVAVVLLLIIIAMGVAPGGFLQIAATAIAAVL
ncbi:NADH-quinone oxidoreductase subunit N [Desulfofustis glycolicus]|uniref:NADH-quinone oxidoreductase subunit N n=1 Tax=Desulfofustis glycolicus DSM 9705 TaxID=1121409 RepID=A0A1M5VTK1_9BACT|nr:NADH-quinone oxidoreductase subunit N [Desulfofustis glycolicus]MCB2216707.1 NADH-quinone oxidoreductase subunit N [Desulfobulbaceae bacterium]SHH78551.1 NADH dehydrogenase subunit N [Desulfofustis glycolicus DSM 9705]